MGLEGISICVRWNKNFTNKDFLVFNGLTWGDNTVSVKLIDSFIMDLTFSGVGFADFSHTGAGGSGVFFSFIGSVENASEHTSLNGTLIHYDTVFLVVSCEAGHSDDRVASDGQLLD